MYKHNTIQPDHEIDNLDRTIDLFKVIYGGHPSNWCKDGALRQRLLKQAHEDIYKMPTPYKKDKGLQLQIDFIVQSFKQPKKTRRNHPCYRDVADRMHRRGVITSREYKKLCA